ncbi:LCP family glycopolymer transferase [Rugosimonospora acidiphila]
MTTPSGRAHVPSSQAGASGRAGVPTTRGTTMVPPTRRRADEVGNGPPGGGGRGGNGGGRGPGGPSGPGGGGRQYRGRRRPHWGRIALVIGAAVALVAVLSGFGIFLYSRHLDSQIARTDPFSQITGGRPPVVAKGAMNILLLGSDSRDPDEKADAGSRTDTIIVMHIQADHKHAYLISIPRDTYVNVPGHGDNKINSAFAFGGLPLVIETVEGFTGVHIDHLALIDFGGFQQVTDALGGVDMYIDKTITSIHPPYRTFQKGTQHLNGAQALDYVRQRYQFPDGDITREKHQQEFLKDILDKAASTGTLTNPSKLNSFLSALTKSMTVDKDFSVADMAWQFRNLRSSDLTFMTSPYSGFGERDGQSVVLSDHDKASALYDAVAKDDMAAYLAGASASPTPGE